MHRPSPPHFITVIKLGLQYRSWNSTLCSFLQSSIISSLSGPDISLSTLFSSTLNLCSSVSVRDQVSHPHKATYKIAVLPRCIYFVYPQGRCTKLRHLLKNMHVYSQYGWMPHDVRLTVRWLKNQNNEECDVASCSFMNSALVQSKYSRFQIDDAGSCWNRVDADRWGVQLSQNIDGDLINHAAASCEFPS